MMLLIDNYDSFTYNLYQYMGIFREDIEVVRNDKITIEEIRQVIGADSLAYLKTERLGEMIGGMGHCTACFTGEYPIAPPTEDIRGSFEK